jgi:hypothetical protein
MPRTLSKLSIDEVSAVDRAANPDAKIVLMKRDARRRELKKVFDRYFRPDGTARKRVADDAVLDAERAAATRAEAAEFVLHSREGHRLSRRFPNSSPSELIDLVCTAGTGLQKRDPLIPDGVRVISGSDALRQGSVDVDSELVGVDSLLGDDDDEREEEQEEETMKNNFETLRTVAKRADGMAAITTSILKSQDGGGLSKAEWDQLLIDHAAATSKRLDVLITGNRDIGKCCDIVARANGLLPSVY